MPFYSYFSSTFDIMQSHKTPALSLTQQIGLTICSILQLSILSTAAILRSLLSGRSSKTSFWYWTNLCTLYFSVIAGLVVGAVLMVATWCELGEHSVEYWADCELSVMLLWSMLLEVSIHWLRNGQKTEPNPEYRIGWSDSDGFWENQSPRGHDEGIFTRSITYWDRVAIGRLSI